MKAKSVLLDIPRSRDSIPPWVRRRHARSPENRGVRVVAITGQDGAQLCARCTVADRPWTRMRGLLGRTGLPEGEGMLFPRTGSVHTMFMRFPIDVVFLDRELTVLSVKPGVPPGGR